MNQFFKLRAIKNHWLQPEKEFLAKIKYEPSIKYTTNKQSVFNQTVTHKRGMYSEDTITCEMILSPDEYLDLKEYLTSKENIYIEFTAGTKYLQMPVTFDKIPPMEDNGRSFKAQYVFTFKSIYYTNKFVDFNLVKGYGFGYGLIYGFS